MTAGDKAHAGVRDDFDGPDLDPTLWLPHYLPQWSSRMKSAARYELRDGCLILRIDRDQEPWSPEFDGWTRVSSLQTGVRSGPLGSSDGQLQFRRDLAVREAQPSEALFTPTYGRIAARARVPVDAASMAALWMIGFEDRPERSGEICVFEIFGRDVARGRARIGMGIHPWADAELTDDFEQVVVEIDPGEFHTYAAEWTPDGVTFRVDGRTVKVSEQSPAYPMQVMLGIYEFADGPDRPSPPEAYPKELAVDWFEALPPER